MCDMPQYERALLAAIYQLRDTISHELVKRGGDSATGPFVYKTHDDYLQEAQYVLESSFKNYSHPAKLVETTEG